jgi:hypothetical protein
MPSSFSTRLRLELQAQGENSELWGGILNTALTHLEHAIAGRAAVTHDDSASYTLTSNNGADDEARNMILNIAGTLTAARNVVVPTVSKLYVVKNATAGGFDITVKTAAGTGIVVANGRTMILFCDGTNVVDAITSLNLAGLVATVATIGTLQGTPHVSGRVTSAAVAVAASSINCSSGNYFTKTVAGATTFTFDSVPSNVYGFMLEVTHTTGDINWPASVSWPDGVTPTLTIGKTHLFQFITRDGGTKWRAAFLRNYVT